MTLTRRVVAAGLAASLVPLGRTAAQSLPPEEDGFRVLAAAPLKMKLHPDAPAEAELWAFNGAVPGPTLRVRHGEEVRVRLKNRTPAPLSLHWHGVRIANAMDGVGGLTQAPVAPGQDFDCRFTPPDAGTYLIRPCVPGASAEAAERGLSGLLVVEERGRGAGRPGARRRPRRLAPQSRRDARAVRQPARGGDERPGRQLPRRCRQAAAARDRGAAGYAPAASPREPLQRPHDPHPLRRPQGPCDRRRRPADGDASSRCARPCRSRPGPATTSSSTCRPDARASGAVTALIGPGVPLVAITAAGAPPKRPALPPIAGLPENKLLPPAIRLQSAARRDVVIAGGARRGAGGEPVYDGDPRKIWTVNGAAGEAGAKPLLSVRRGTPVVLAINNTTPTIQPLHLHGHVFRLLHAFDDGWEPYFLDTDAGAGEPHGADRLRRRQPRQVASRLDRARALRHRAVDLVRGDLIKARGHVIPEAARRLSGILRAFTPQTSRAVLRDHPPGVSRGPPASPPEDPRRSAPARTAARPRRGSRRRRRPPRRAASPAPGARRRCRSSTSPEPAVARSGVPFSLIAARPSGAAITVSAPFRTTIARVSAAARRARSSFDAPSSTPASP